MQLRWKRPLIGDVVTVRDCEMYFHLPDGLRDGTRAILVGDDSGRYIVQALGRDWNIPMQCLKHEEEFNLNGLWLPRDDRRLQKAMAIEQRRTRTSICA